MSIGPGVFDLWGSKYRGFPLTRRVALWQGESPLRQFCYSTTVPTVITGNYEFQGRNYDVVWVLKHHRNTIFKNYTDNLTVNTPQNKKLSYRRDRAHLRSLRLSRSFKVIEFDINQKPVCEFLIVNNTNLHSISHRFLFTAQ